MLQNQWLFTLCLLMTSYLPATAALSSVLSSDIITVAPAFATPASSGGFDLSFQLPCGAEYLGIAMSQSASHSSQAPSATINSRSKSAHPKSSFSSFHTISASKKTNKGNQTLKIGAAYKASKFRCMKMPSTQKVHVSGIYFPKNVEFRPFFPSLKKTPLRFARTQSLSILKKNIFLRQNVSQNNQPKTKVQSSYVVALNYMKSCSALMDPVYVIERSGQQTLKVGMLEHRKARKSNIKCNHKFKVHELPFTISTKVQKLESLKAPTVELISKPIYKLKPLKNIEYNSVAQTLSAKYKRRCNEAPVGVFIGRKINGNQSVAMVVASYRDQRLCRQKDNSDTWSQYKLSGIKVQTELSSIKNEVKANGDLQIHTPKKITRSRSKYIRLSSTHACGKIIGSVVSQSKDKLLMGEVLLGKKTSVCDSPLATRTRTTSLSSAKSLKKIVPMAITSG